ncbi:glycosyltransferase [Bifidobacterium eulemuris]|uniref:glycosyltransferase n=1 Tax=Bifidobacterium eulemuris TaxID=1765219 RepID=UPI001B802FBB|nr:glycosyltransferase [Bifidobacterium eulemuris]
MIYNEDIDNVSCLAAAIESQMVCDIVVCDNSTVPNDNAQKAAAIGVTYVSMHGNKGLSVAYNIGISYCGGDVICVFDDDTTVTSYYFEALETLDTVKDWDIALPLVMAKGRILSPSEFNGFYSKSFSDVLEIKISERMSGINSGMVIKRKVFDSVRYDEHLFLDLIDHRFIQDARNQGYRIIFFPDMVLKQSYSFQSDSENQAYFRFQIFLKDAEYFYSTSFAKRAYFIIWALSRRMKFCVKFKTLRFMC